MTMGTIGFRGGLIISLIGFVVVFTILIVLALATIVISKLVNSTARVPAANAVKAAPAMPEEDENEALLAVLHGAVSMESGLPTDRFAIVSVNEIT